MSKKLFFLSLCLLLAFFVFPKSNDTIRVLAIGNSFSADAVENYLYDLGKADNVIFIIGNMYIGGCSLEKHWTNADNDAGAYSYRKINADGVKNTTASVKLSDVIPDEPWDYITFQQASKNSGIYDTYFPYLTNLLNYVKAKAVNPSVQYVLHMTWAYAQNASHSGFANYGNNQLQMYNAIADAVKRAADTENIRIIIPAGTAIQNARATYLGDVFCRDGYHLNSAGQYTVACTWYEVLSRKSVMNNTFKLDNISEKNAEIIRLSVHHAVKRPFNVYSKRKGKN